eukprot:CCRYP_005958-RC/>CCRYP_005958-RC protein AED:0.26 eAED:0.26 QI:1702/1/1/1/0.86/0.89/38/579/1095
MDRPTLAPSLSPSIAPTIAPSITPSLAPTISPTISPSGSPTLSPSLSPSITPSRVPTLSPALGPTVSPTLAPTLSPSITPSVVPTLLPTPVLSVSPTLAPSLSPSLSLSVLPTLAPTSSEPTISPSFTVTTQVPTQSLLTESPTLGPSPSPTLSPSLIPTLSTTTLVPTITPTLSLVTETPTLLTEVPTISPSLSPTTPVPTETPTILTETPTIKTESPTLQPTATPTAQLVNTLDPVPTPSTNAPTLSSSTAKPTEAETDPPTDQTTSVSSTAEPTSSSNTVKPTLRSNTAEPTPKPFPPPVSPPSERPTNEPTKPMVKQTNTPTAKPIVSLTYQPTFFPTEQRSTFPPTARTPALNPDGPIPSLTKAPIPPRVSPISPAPINIAIGLLCLPDDDDSVGLLEERTPSRSSNLFRPRESGGKSGKAGSKSVKGKSGKGAKSLQPECYTSAGPYRTCFHRWNTFNTCNTIVDERPPIGLDEVLLSGTMYLTLLQEISTVTCEKEIQLERALLTYLADNVGSDSTFEPVCVYAAESAQSQQLVPNRVGQFVESTAIKMQVQYIQKTGSRKLDTNTKHDERHLQSNACTPTDRALCCSQHAINGFVAKHCASLGCSLNKCGSGRRPRKLPRNLSHGVDFDQTHMVERRTGKSGKSAKAAFFHGKSAKAQYHVAPGAKPAPIDTCPWYGMLFGQEFNEVVRKYTLFNPELSRSLLGVESTSSVAICSANRYSIDEFSTPSLRCDAFIQERCPQNEDLPTDVEITTPQPIAPPPVPAPMTPAPIFPPVSKPTPPPSPPDMSEPPIVSSLPPVGNAIPTLPPGLSNPPVQISLPPQSNLLPTLPPFLNSGPPIMVPTLPPGAGGLPTLPPNSSSPPIVTVFTPAPSTSTLTSSPWDFESGVFPERPWRTGGNGVWAIDSSKVDGGIYSIKSPDLASTNIPGPLVSNATLTLADDFTGGLLSARVLASVAPPIDVFVIYVDGVSAAQLTDSQEFNDVVFSVEPGGHTIDFSYQYNIFGVDPLPPSPENRLGAVWIDSVTIEPLPQRNFKLFRYFFKSSESDKISMLEAIPDTSGSAQSKQSAGLFPPLFFLGCTMIMLLNRL